MGDNRRIFSDNEKMVLFNEVDGRCPICGKPLTNTKNGQIIKMFEVAHIYPANPRPEEVELLKDEERLLWSSFFVTLRPNFHYRSYTLP